MKQEEGPQSQIQWGKLTLAVLPFLLAAAVLLWLIPRLQQAPVLDSDTILAEGEFSDGSRVEILEAAAAKSLKMDSRRWQPFWRLVKTNRSSTYGKGNLDLEMTHKNGVFESVELQRKSPGLILLLRIREPSGIELVPECAFFADDAQFTTVKRDADGIFDEFVDIPVSAFPKPEAEYEIEVEDGGGGWLKTSGPIAIDGQDGRAFAVAPVFSRRARLLKLRVRREGLQEPVVVEIPNPGHDPAGFSSWTIDPKPWRKKLSEVEVAVDGIEKMHISKLRRALPSPQYRIEPLGDLSPKAFQLEYNGVEDETGNRASVWEFQVLPGTDKLRYFGRVGRSERYPWTTSEVLIVAETTWTGQKGEQDLSLLPDGEQLGLEKGILSAPAAGQTDWQFALSGQAPKKDLPKRFRIVVFLEDEKDSNKISRGVSGSTRHLRRDVSKFDYTIKWRGDIPSGKKVRIGILPESTKDDFDFILPIDPTFAR